MSYQTVARFDCKMTLGFEPSSGRFLFDDGVAQYFSACTFESYMWHHAMVSINDEGVGQIFVDGDPVAGPYQYISICFNWDFKLFVSATT